MRPMALFVLSFVVVLAAACGGGNDSSSALSAKTQSITSCLMNSGLHPKAEDALPLGVDDPIQGLTVPLQSQSFHEGYHAEIWVFESGAAAKNNRPAITLQTHDDERNKMIGPVVVQYSIVPDPDDTKQVEACL